MRTIILTIAALAALATMAQVKHLQPTTVTLMPSYDVNKFEELFSKAEMDSLSNEERLLYNQGGIYEDLYAGYCSWYCGGEVLSVKSSSHLARQGSHTYEATNAHDFRHDCVWAEGVKGHGVGEWLEYEFAGGCPRITTVKVLNGHVRTPTTWRNNNRVKSLMVYYMGEPLAILDLEDSRSLQEFDVGVLGPHDDKAANWTLRFKILDVYPGEKYDDTVISELYFDGIDVH